MRIKRFDISRRGLVIGAAAGLASLPAWAEDGHGSEPPSDASGAPRPVRRVIRKPAPKPAPAAVPGHGAESIGPEDAMARLIAGNARYVADKASHPHGDAAYRRVVAQVQHPFATILACADSRVAPEIIFDQGLGDLFVVRVAGNVVDDAVLASIEYSVIHLGASLVMVLGHERCGAVKATMDALNGRGSDDDRDTKIGALASFITPAVKAVPAGAADPLDAAVSLNVSQAAAEVFAGSKPLRSRVLAGKLKIVAARYDLDDGRVTPTKSQGQG